MVKTLEKEIIVDKPGRLLEVHVELPRYQSNVDTWFNEGNIRKVLKKKFDPSATYTFLTTVANPAAMEAVERKFYTKDSDSVRTRFDAEVNDIYLSAIDSLAEQGDLAHSSYPLVRNDGVHMLERHWDQPKWPVVHVVRDDVSKFERILGGLNADRAYQHIARKQAPHNYYMHIINFLREQGIAPLLTSQRTWTVKGQELKNAVDFLEQFEYGRRWTGGTIDVD